MHNINYLDNTTLCVPLGLIIKNNLLSNNNSEIDPMIINEKMLKEDIYEKLVNSVKYELSDLYDTKSFTNKKTNEKTASKKHTKKLMKKNKKNKTKKY